MNPLFLLAIAPLVAATPPGIAAMQGQRRVLLVSASTAHDPALERQRRIVARWRVEAAARDLSVVELVGDTVTGIVIGATDTADALRRRYRVPATGFTAVLIGKDGGDKLRARHPLSAAMLQATIDAMPMRRTGER